jgi:hypothetical protein
MYKKTESHALDIPEDDLDCWNRYPKHRWVYDLSRLLDAQNIKWTPFETEGMQREINSVFYTKDIVIRQPGFIYIEPNTGEHLFTEVYILKGEIKLMRHIDSNKGLKSLIGDIELRLNAFVSLYFSKFTGVFTAETYGNKIYRITLRPHSDLSEEKNTDVIKNAKRIYKKSEAHISGLSDQVLNKETAS